MRHTKKSPHYARRQSLTPERYGIRMPTREFAANALEPYYSAWGPWIEPMRFTRKSELAVATRGTFHQLPRSRWGDPGWMGKIFTIGFPISCHNMSDSVKQRALSGFRNHK